jgi:hypothetical protein
MLALGDVAMESASQVADDPEFIDDEEQAMSLMTEGGPFIEGAATAGAVGLVDDLSLDPNRV